MLRFPLCLNSTKEFHIRANFNESFSIFIEISSNGNFSKSSKKVHLKSRTQKQDLDFYEKSIHLKVNITKNIEEVFFQKFR